MPAWLGELLNWLILAVLLVASIDTILGGVLREKLMQMLQRSLTKDIENHKAALSKDLENHKSELTKSQAEHAASLLPQLERIKHDFERELAAYKVGLIAEAEAAKAKAELKKSIALRYSEIEFERLADLEQIVTGLAVEITGSARMSIQYKSIEQGQRAIDKFVKLNAAIDRAEIFLTLEDGQRFLEYKRLLLEIINSHVGYQKPILADNDPTGENLIRLHVDLKNILRERIKELGKY